MGNNENPTMKMVVAIRHTFESHFILHRAVKIFFMCFDWIKKFQKQNLTIIDLKKFCKLHMVQGIQNLKSVNDFTKKSIS